MGQSPQLERQEFQTHITVTFPTFMATTHQDTDNHSIGTNEPSAHKNHLFRRRPTSHKLTLSHHDISPSTYHELHTLLMLSKSA